VSEHDYLTPRQRQHRDALAQRRDAVLARNASAAEDVDEFLATMLAIMEDPRQSPDDLLHAIETHVRRLEDKYPPPNGHREGTPMEHT
jgi:hypothetical protein